MILDDLKALVEIESPTDDLDACKKVIDKAVEITEHIHGEAAKVILEKGRPVFWFGSENPAIVLLAHLDTVWPVGSYLPLWSNENDVIRGPGCFDMKAGFIQALYAMKDLPRDRMALIATSDEETGSATSKELIQRVAKNAKAVLVLEASLDGKVKTGRKGTSMYQISVHGRAAHAGLEPEKGINSTVEIAHLVRAIVALENSATGTSVVPTKLNSGTTTNTVPALAVLDIDARSFEMSELERVDRAIRNLRTIHPDARIEVSGGINRPPLEEKDTMALYQRFEKVVASLSRPTVGHAKVGGASDGNFAAAAGAPTLDGLGAVGGGAHALTEWVQASSVQDRANLLHEFLKDLLTHE